MLDKRLKRQKQAQARKNFLPTLVITLLFWLILGVIVYFVEPETFGAVPAFFAIVFLALLFTFSTIFANSRRGLVTALVLTSFVILRYFGIGNFINFALLVGLGITAEAYFTKTRG